MRPQTFTDVPSTRKPSSLRLRLQAGADEPRPNVGEIQKNHPNPAQPCANSSKRCIKRARGDFQAVCLSRLSRRWNGRLAVMKRPSGPQAVSPDERASTCKSTLLLLATVYSYGGSDVPPASSRSGRGNVNQPDIPHLFENELRGSVTRTVARRGLPGKMADDDLICPPPVSARDHPACRLALCAFHSQLSRRRRFAR